MKRFIILAVLLAAPALTLADGLISVPGGAIEEFDGINPALLDPAPKAGSDDDFAWWVTRRVKSAKKNRMVELSIKYPYKQSVKCLLFPDAFGFNDNDDPMTMNCFAGNKKEITHILTYQAKIVVKPDSCNNFTTLKNYFGPEARRTAPEAEKLVSTCWVQAEPVKFDMPPLLNAQKISPAWLETELNQPKYENLRHYIMNSKEAKKAAAEKEKQAKSKSEKDDFLVDEAD